MRRPKINHFQSCLSLILHLPLSHYSHALDVHPHSQEPLFHRITKGGVAFVSQRLQPVRHQIEMGFIGCFCRPNK